VEERGVIPGTTSRGRPADWSESTADGLIPAITSPLSVHSSDIMITGDGLPVAPRRSVSIDVASRRRQSVVVVSNRTQHQSPKHTPPVYLYCTCSISLASQHHTANYCSIDKHRSLDRARTYKIHGTTLSRVCNVINVLLMTFYHVTRSSISYVVQCLLAVQMTSTLFVLCSMLSECLRVRYGLLKLPDCFSQSDINDIIRT